MSVNKYMHPRNIYKTAPNFKQLAIQYPEFLKFIKQDVSGKVVIDFKDEASLRALTTTLLHKDFGLTVEIPLNHLIPTLPLRLNYLLWIEDLLKFNRYEDNRTIRGIDIGTGASCIYPLLAAKTNKWIMLATEADKDNVETAKRNVEANNLSDIIDVKLVEDDIILNGAVELDKSYDFCMCNPPFFSSGEELDSRKKSRTEQRPPPRNVQTGTLNEVIVPGGEVKFVGKMIEESMDLKSKVRIYTSMVGHKSSLRPLKEKLSKVGVASWTWTEFCQGHTTRWGLAWTFNSGTDLEQHVSKHSRKKPKPITYTIPQSSNFSSYELEVILPKVRTILDILEIQYKKLKDSPNLHAFEISAAKNTWSHQRRQRRQKVNQIKEEEINSVSDVCSIANVLKHQIEITKLCKREREGTDSDSDENESKKQKIATIQPESSTGASISHAKTSDSSTFHCVLRASLILKKQDSNISLELLFLDGYGGKEAANQVLQYFKNNLK